jgi:hypothetical protein
MGWELTDGEWSDTSLNEGASGCSESSLPVGPYPAGHGSADGSSGATRTTDGIAKERQATAQITVDNARLAAANKTPSFIVHPCRGRAGKYAHLRGPTA